MNSEDEPASLNKAVVCLVLAVLVLIMALTKPHPAIPPPVVQLSRTQASAPAKPPELSRTPALPQAPNPPPPPVDQSSAQMDRNTAEQLATLEAQSGYLKSQISQLQTQQDYYLQKATTLNHRSTTRSPSYSTSYGYNYNGTYCSTPYYSTRSGTIHSDPAQAMRAEMQAGQIANQISALQSQHARVESQIRVIRNPVPRSGKGS